MIRGYFDFIVHIPEKYSPTFTTESGFTIHADRRFSLKQVANTVVEVVKQPFGYEGPIGIGDHIFIDPSVLMQQIYSKLGEAPNIYLIDQKQSLYKVDPNMILAYQDGEQWKGYNGNLFAKRLAMPKIKSDHLTVIQSDKTGLNDNVARKGRVVIPGSGVEVDDVVWFRNLYCVDVWFKQRELVWIRERDLLAKEVAA